MARKADNQRGGSHHISTSLLLGVLIFNIALAKALSSVAFEKDAL
jgi:hypothetical protein